MHTLMSLGFLLSRGGVSTLNSCIIQLVFVPFGGFPLQKTSAFLYPITVSSNMIGLSAPEAFQYPSPAARFGRTPFKYFRSLGVKKYNSFSPHFL